MIMTIIEAIKAKMYPFVLPEDALNLLLIEQGFEDSSMEYDANDTGLKDKMRLAAIEGLYQCMPLKEESDNGSTLKYDSSAIKDKIKHLEGDSPTKAYVRDMTKARIW